MGSRPSPEFDSRDGSDAIHKHGYSLATGIAVLRAEIEEIDAECIEETEAHTVTEKCQWS